MMIPEKIRRTSIGITLPIEIIQSPKVKELIQKRKFSERVADLLYKDLDIPDNRKQQEEYINKHVEEVFQNHPELLQKSQKQ